MLQHRKPSFNKARLKVLHASEDSSIRALLTSLNLTEADGSHIAPGRARVTLSCALDMREMSCVFWMMGQNSCLVSILGHKGRIAKARLIVVLLTLLTAVLVIKSQVKYQCQCDAPASHLAQ